jgi:hypothetical protein
MENELTFSEKITLISMLRVKAKTNLQNVQEFYPNENDAIRKILLNDNDEYNTIIQKLQYSLGLVTDDANYLTISK